MPLVTYNSHLFLRSNRSQRCLQGPHGHHNQAGLEPGDPLLRDGDPQGHVQGRRQEEERPDPVDGRVRCGGGRRLRVRQHPRRRGQDPDAGPRGVQVQEHARLRRPDMEERGTGRLLQGDGAQAGQGLPGRGHHVHDIRQLHGAVQEDMALTIGFGLIFLLGCVVDGDCWFYLF